LPLIFLVIVFAVVISIWFYVKGDDWKLFLPVVGAAVSLIYVIQKQQLEEAKLFKEYLFSLMKNTMILMRSLTGSSQATRSSLKT